MVTKKNEKTTNKGKPKTKASPDSIKRRRIAITNTTKILLKISTGNTPTINQQHTNRHPPTHQQANTQKIRTASKH